MTLLAALACVFAAAWLGARVARSAGVPTVVGQMCGGVLVGPLCAGSLWPQLYADVFTAHNKAVLTQFGTVAACLFLFVAGATHQGPPKAPRRAVASLAIGNGLAAAVGAAAMVGLADTLAAVRPDVSSGVFLALVLAVCAVPVLFRIIDERRLIGTRAAHYAVTIAVSTDIVVWCVVALLGALHAQGAALRGIARLSLVFALVLAWGLWRHHIRRLGAAAGSPLAVVVIATGYLAVGVGLCRVAGLDPLIGALLAGAVFGSGRHGTERPRLLRADWLRWVNANVALPVFFASVGLGAMPPGDGWTLFALATAMTVVAIGVRWTAVFCGGRRSSLAAGELRTLFWLICARGGTELALLKVGHDAGLLPPALYSPAVVMAIVTTALSGALTPRGCRAERSHDVPAPVHHGAG